MVKMINKPLKAVENLLNNHIVVVGGRGIEFRDIKSMANNPMIVIGIMAFLSLKFQIKGIKHLILL
jgi:hypothetical protein